MTARSLRSLVLALAPILGGSMLAACTKTPIQAPPLTVTITSPTAGQQIKITDDVDPGTPGIQINVVASVTGATSAASATVLVDGSSPSILGGTQHLDPNNGAQVVTFAKVPLPAGTHTISVQVTDANANPNTATDQKNVSVESSAACTFLKPVDGATLSTDEDPSTTVFEQAFQVSCTGIPNGTAVKLTDAVVVGTHQQTLLPVTGTLDANGVASFDKVALGEGKNNVIFEADDAAGNSLANVQETVTVSTGGCPVVLADINNVIYNAAGGIPPSDPRSVTADLDPITAGIQETFTAYVDTTVCADGTATISFNGAAGASTASFGSDGKLTFSSVTVPDGDPVLEVVKVTSGTQTGTSLPNTYGVDSLIPTIAISAPSSATLGPSDDIDPATVGLQTHLGIHATNVDAATQVAFTDNNISLLTVTSGITLDGSGNYTFPQPVTLPGGVDALVATATRRLGNSGNGNFTTTVNESSLQITLIHPATTTVVCTHAPTDTTDEIPSTDNCDITMLVQVDPSATEVDFTSADGGSSTVAASGFADGGYASFQFSLPQGDGQIITATAHDATTTAAVNVTVSVHTIGPGITITSPTASSSTLTGQTQTVTVHVTGAAANEQVVLTSTDASGNVSTIGTATVQSVDASGAADLSFTNVNLPLGSQTLTATITDTYGNPGSASLPVTVVNNGECDLVVAGGTPQIFNIAGTTPGTGTQRTATLSGTTTLCKGQTVTVSKVLGHGTPQVVGTATADASTGAWSLSVSFDDAETDDTLEAAIGAGAQLFNVDVIYTADFTPPSFDELLPAAGALKLVAAGDARAGSNGFVADEDNSAAGGQFTPTVEISNAGRVGTLAEQGAGSLTITGGGLATGVGLAAISSNAQQTFNSQLSFPDGAAQTVTLTATDAAGNSVSQTWSVAVATQALPTLGLSGPTGTLNVFRDEKSNRVDHIDVSGLVAASAVFPAGTELYVCSAIASPGATKTCLQVSPTGMVVPGSDETFGGTGPAPSNSAFWADLQFAEGSYQVFAEAVSAVGDVVDSAANTITVDSVPPVVSSVSVQEDANSDHILSQSELSGSGGSIHVNAAFTGVEDGQVASLTGTGNTYTATVSGNAASFVVPVTDLSDGSNINLKVTVKDAAGNPNESNAVSPPITNPTDSYSVRVANSGPSISVISPTFAVCNLSNGGSASTHTCNIAFTVAVGAAAGLTVTEVDFTGPGAPSSPDVVIPSGGIASANYAVPEGGSEILTATVKDSAGNSAAVTVNLAVDVTAPVLAITAPSSGASEAQQSFTVTVTSSDSGTVNILSSLGGIIGSGTVVGGTAVITVHAPIGTQTLTATLTDADGNPGTAPGVSVDVDAPGCDLTFTNPPNSSITLNSTSGNALSVAGFSTKCPNTAISFFTQVGAGARTLLASGTTDASGHFTQSVTFTDGAVTIFTAEMVQGADTNDDSFTATVDTAAPTIVINSPTASASGTLFVVAATGNRHVAAGDVGYVADASPVNGGQVNVTVTVTGGGSVSGTANGTLLVTDASGNTLATLPISSISAVQLSPQITLPQAYQGAVNFRVTNAVGSVATASWSTVAVDVVPPPAPTLVTSDPGTGVFTHVVNQRHADLDVAFTTPTDDGLAGQPVSVEFGYSTSTLLDGGTLDETGYNNPAVTTKVTVSAAPVVNVPLNAVPPLNTYYLAPRAVDSVGNVSAFQAGTLDVNWTTETIPYPGTTSATAFFGVQVATGDINGDGKSDVAVFAQGENGFRGAVYVYYGSATFPLASPQVITGPSNVFVYGIGLSLGDINGDGKADLVVIAGDHADVYLSNGSQLPTSPSFSIQGDASLAGTAIVKDLNHDGLDDLVLWSNSTGGGGTAYVLYGRSNWTSFNGTLTDSTVVTISEPTAGATLGGSARGVRSIPDLDADGYNELFIGEPGLARGYVVLGKNLATHGSGTISTLTPLLVSAPSGQGASGFGTAAASYDFDGDSAPDLAIGSDTQNGDLFSSLQTGTDQFGTSAVSLVGTNFFAEAVTSGDLDGDGKPDLIASTAGNDLGYFRFFGSRASQHDLSHNAGAAWGRDGYGADIALADVNGDGALDVVVGEFANGNGNVYVIY